MATSRRSSRVPGRRKSSLVSSTRGRGETMADARRRWTRALVLTALFGVVVALAARYFMREARPDFDGERALAYVAEQVAFGPRAPGTEGHGRTLAYLVETLRASADRVDEHRFPYTDRRDTTRTYEGVNVVASFNPAAGRRVMLAAHWDTRPRADRDPDPARRHLPVPGANDGASGVAVLLEMARVLRADPPDVGVDLVLFDLEDLGDEADSASTGNPFAIGSAAFAEAYPQYRPAYGILLDMVCDRALRIPQEAHSVAYARPVVERIWAAARRVGADAFVDAPGQAVFDDHVAFLQRGIRVVDLIHTPFPATWHTTADTPDRCSAESLQQVGDVLVEVLYSE